MTYLFPIATTSSVGLVQAGNNISIDANGVISTTGGGSVTTGTWTPFLDTTGQGVYVIVNRYATYSKIGQQVTCYFDFSVTSLSGGSNSNTLFISGLPFTSDTTTLGSVGSLYCSYIFGVSGGSYAGTITGTVPSASTKVNLWETDGVSIGLKQESVKALSILAGTITYISAS